MSRYIQNSSVYQDENPDCYVPHIRWYHFFSNWQKPCTDAEKNVFDAAKNGDIHKLKRFIKMDGTLVDSRDEYNNTALIIASKFGQNETIDLSIGCCVT